MAENPYNLGIPLTKEKRFEKSIREWIDQEKKYLQSGKIPILWVGGSIDFFNSILMENGHHPVGKKQV